MKYTQLFILVLTIGLLTACGKELTTPIEAEKVAIVESYLYAGDSIITVKVSKMLPYSDDTSAAIEYISGLQLLVNGIAMTETATGVYTLQLGDKRIQPGELYSMKFLYFSDTVTSTTIIPDKPVNFSISSGTVYADRMTSTGGMPGTPMEDVALTWDNADTSYYYVLIEYLETSFDYINSNMEDSDLSAVQGISPVSSSGTRLGMRNLYFFGSYRIILFKVNSDFADLYQTATANSNNITNPVTTINNGYGVFTGMASDTVYLEVVEN